MARLIILLMIAGGLQFAWKHYGQTPANSVSISQSASQIKSGDIVMYSTTECAYCTEAKSWLTQNGFAFTECNMSIDQRCQQEFNALGANGTPYLIVRGHHMKEGFDSDEFLQAVNA